MPISEQKLCSFDATNIYTLQMASINMRKKTGKKILLILILIGAIVAWKGYTMVFSPNVFLKNKQETFDFTVPSGATVADIITKLQAETEIEYIYGFTLLAKFAELDAHLYSGLYTIHNGMSNKELVILFRSAKRKTVKVRVGFGRYAREVVKSIAPKIEASEEDLLNLLNDPEYTESLGFSRYNVICLFLPDTYFFNWNTSAEDFYTRMLKEYITFWNNDRLQKAEDIGMTAKEVMTLASIIDQETNKNDEKDVIAGVYMNRLRIGQALQADPTVKYALSDFTIKRIRSKHTKGTKSKYNTYMYKGLPPGPICTPSKAGIDAVLNYKKHNYFYFCARPGYTGYHNFAPNFTIHKQNARKYQRWLNSEGY